MSNRETIKGIRDQLKAIKEAITGFCFKDLHPRSSDSWHERSVMKHVTRNL
jgi:hypothetical protein